MSTQDNDSREIAELASLYRARFVRAVAVMAIALTIVGAGLGVYCNSVIQRHSEEATNQRRRNIELIVHAARDDPLYNAFHAAFPDVHPSTLPIRATQRLDLDPNAVRMLGVVSGRGKTFYLCTLTPRYDPLYIEVAVISYRLEHPDQRIYARHTMDATIEGLKALAEHLNADRDAPSP